MIINFKIVVLILIIVVMVRVVIRNVIDGINKVCIVFCKRINEKYVLNYIKYLCRYFVNLIL